MMNDVVKGALEVAKTQVGVREQGGANMGVQVNAYLKSTGLGPGYPWCAAFVNWCINKALTDRNWDKDIPWIRTASCGVINTWADDNNILFTQPQVGDVFLVYAGTRAHHTGFVSDLTANGRFATIEGNTNIDGSSEGIGVFARSRPISIMYKFVRWANLLPADSSWKILIRGKAGVEPLMVGNRLYYQVRDWGKKVGVNVGWDNNRQLPTFDGSIIITQIVLKDGSAYAPIRDLAMSQGWNVIVDNATHIVKVG